MITLGWRWTGSGRLLLVLAMVGLALLLLQLTNFRAYTETLTTSLNLLQSSTAGECPSIRPLRWRSKDYPNVSCRPQHHIMFLKTHKCASTSVQNMLLRYGIHNDLTFALPDFANYIGNPTRFKASSMSRRYLPPEGVVDVFAVHTRLQPEEHRQVVHSDASYITVLRDPVYLFESLYNFYHMRTLYEGHTLEKYLDLPLQTQMKFRENHDKLGYNMMLFDMGFDIHPNLTAIEVRCAIDQMDELFDVVLIAEKMDESLILLKEHLCWDYSDMIFFSKNARREGFKREMSAETIQKLRQLNSADWLLYSHFLAKHEMAVLRYGVDKMAAEVSRLRSLRQQYFEDCGTRVVQGFNPDAQFREYSDQVEAYVLDSNSDENCILLSTPELQLLDKLRAMYLNKTDRLRRG